VRGRNAGRWSESGHRAEAEVGNGRGQESGRWVEGRAGRGGLDPGLIDYLSGAFLD
jgi:hypothetical protein